MAAGTRVQLALAAGVALAGPVAAMVSQHVYDMQPCPWCVLQRLIFLAVALTALVGTLLPSAFARRCAAGVALLFTLCGMAAALWQNQVAAASASCKRTLADRIVSGAGLDALWPDMFMATASCADARVSLLGLPYEIYSLALFGALTVLMLRVLRGAA